MSGPPEKPARPPRRSLRADEHALWSDVIRSIAPLKRKRAAPLSEAADPAAETPAAAPKAAAPTGAARPSAKPRAPALAPFDRRLKQRLARGREPIDAKIDLHGLTQAQAHDALARFLRRAHEHDARIVLVVTGKGARGDGADTERGVLRRQVPLWLKSPQLRDYVIGFDAAGIGHGGDGALYVRIRRAR